MNESCPLASGVALINGDHTTGHNTFDGVMFVNIRRALSKSTEITTFC